MARLKNRFRSLSLMSSNDMDTLQTILDLLNPGHIQTGIEEPIEKACTTFRYDWTEPMTHQQFNRIITAFVMHINTAVCPHQPHLPSEKAFEEAVWILENGYRTDCAEGYDGALLDAVDPERGIDSVLASMKEVIKAREQDKYLSWVFAAHIDPTDWQLHVRLTEEILSRFNAERAPTTILLSPPRFARHCIDLIKMYSSYQKYLQSPLDR
jgi:hypothetical protein